MLTLPVRSQAGPPFPLAQKPARASTATRRSSECSATRSPRCATPQAINPLFLAAGANIVCVPLRVARDDLRTVWAGLRAAGNVIGLTLTLPHKEDALALCDSLDAQAERVGAVNVVRREADGSFRGYQFDGRGFVDGLLSQHHDPKGRNCLLIGAGGAAKAIAFALLEAGAVTITICNRTRHKAEALADHVNRVFGSDRVLAGDPVPCDHDLIVNATSLGMRADDPLPVAVDRINATMLVADAIAEPAKTRLLCEAEKRGAAIHSGEHMIANQIHLIARHFIDAPR